MVVVVVVVMMVEKQQDSGSTNSGGNQARASVPGARNRPDVHRFVIVLIPRAVPSSHRDALSYSDEPGVNGNEQKRPDGGTQQHSENRNRNDTQCMGEKQK